MNYKLSVDGVILQKDDGSEIHFSEDSRHWVKYQTWLDEGNEPEPFMTPEEEVLYNLAIAESEIRSKYAKLMSEVAKPYLPEERETWFKQQIAAEAYSNDGTITPFIQSMATARGISVGELIVKIEENINLYDDAIATLLGQQQKEIDELTTS
jgi:hypothetical protein